MANAANAANVGVTTSARDNATGFHSKQKRSAGNGTGPFLINRDDLSSSLQYRTTFGFQKQLNELSH
jgi:hypothetical protein